MDSKGSVDESRDFQALSSRRRYYFVVCIIIFARRSENYPLMRYLNARNRIYVKSSKRKKWILACKDYNICWLNDQCRCYIQWLEIKFYVATIPMYFIIKPYRGSSIMNSLNDKIFQAIACLTSCCFMGGCTLSVENKCYHYPRLLPFTFCFSVGVSFYAIHSLQLSDPLLITITMYMYIYIYYITIWVWVDNNTSTAGRITALI